MVICEMDAANVNVVTDLAYTLWPDSEWEELNREFREIIDDVFQSARNIVYLAAVDGLYIAFIHVSIRQDYVEGSTTSPVGYVEGIYVKPAYRRQGISKKLVQSGEKWAASQGCTQIASDALLDNTDSHAFHRQVGFQEANRIVCFIKNISS